MLASLGRLDDREAQQLLIEITAARNPHHWPDTLHAIHPDNTPILLTCINAWTIDPLNSARQPHNPGNPERQAAAPAGPTPSSVLVRRGQHSQQRTSPPQFTNPDSRVVPPR